jgi:N12 class adenine-specific DNA methylase
MASRAEAIDILVDKGNFEPQVALAVVEAVVVMITEAQIVTVPVLDSRVAELRAEIRQVDHKIDLTKIGLEAKIDATRMDLEGKIERFKSDLEAKIDATRMNLEAKIELAKAELAKLIESTKAELVRWVLLAMLGSGAIQAGAAAFINAVQHH